MDRVVSAKTPTIDRTAASISMIDLFPISHPRRKASEVHQILLLDNEEFINYKTWRWKHAAKRIRIQRIFFDQRINSQLCEQTVRWLFVWEKIVVDSSIWMSLNAYK